MWSRLAAARLRGLNLGLIYNREPFGDLTFTLVLLFVSFFLICISVVLPTAWTLVFKDDALSTYFHVQSLLSAPWFDISLFNFDSYTTYTAAAGASRAARDAEVASLRADAAANGGRLSSLRLARALPALAGLNDPLAAAAACAASARAGRAEAAPAGAVLVAAGALRASPRVVADGGGGKPAVVWEVPASRGGGGGIGDDAAAGAAARNARDNAETARNEFFAQFSLPLPAAVLAAQGAMAAALTATVCVRYGGTPGSDALWWIVPLLTGYSAMCLAPAAGWVANGSAGRAAADEAAAWSRGGDDAARGDDEPGSIDWSPAGLRKLEAEYFDARMRRAGSKRGQE